MFVRHAFGDGMGEIIPRVRAARRASVESRAIVRKGNNYYRTGSDPVSDSGHVRIVSRRRSSVVTRTFRHFISRPGHRARRANI